jgi:MFS family permease
MTSQTIDDRGDGTGATSEVRVLAGISVAHWVSHFHILTLPPLFPILKATLGVSYIQLGFAMTVFALVSMFTQAPMGVLVDRVGARKILLAGLCVGGSAFVLVGLVPTYTGLLACTAIAGLANSVYHPCDYSILNTGIRERRLGRAFSIHTFAGFFGGAVAPAVVLVLAARFGIQTALIVAGTTGFAAAVLLLFVGLPEPQRADGASTGASSAASGSLSVVLSPAILMLTLFFILLSLSNGGINGFSVAALIGGYGLTEVAAGSALTAYLGLMAAGVLTGGFLAERTSRHGLVAAGCFSVSALMVLAVALVPLTPALVIATLGAAGFFSGVIAPSRDMLVRKAAPPGAMGRAFAVVSTGFNIGMTTGPLLYGWIMDIGLPRWIFIVTAIMMILTVLLSLATERREAASADG